MSLSEEVLYHCMIPGRTAIKKNGKQIRFNRKTQRPFIASSNKLETWVLFAGPFIARAKRLPTIDYPINVSMKFYFKNHAHEADLSNCYQASEDLLQKLGVIKDDKLIYSHDGSMKIFNDPNERVEIVITKFKLPS